MSNTNNSSVASTAPNQCIDGCGFFGSPATDNRCSQCHKKWNDEQVAINDSKAETLPTSPKKQISEGSLSQLDQRDAISTMTPSQPAQVRKNRCLHYNKKVGLYGFKCKCEGIFCEAHRHGTLHQCSYDGWKSDVTNQLQKQLVKVEKARVNNF